MPDGQQQYFIQGLVPQDELTRFCTYTRRVRYLNYVALHHENIAPSVFPLLSQLAGGSPLFPSLRLINWEQPDSFETALSAFLSPSLQALSVAISYTKQIGVEGPAIEILICNFVIQAPSLELLTIQNIRTSALLRQNLVHFKRLRSLTITAPLTAPQVTDALTQLENLNDLTITLEGSEVEPSDTPHASFHCLQQLYIHRGTASGILHILQAAGSSIRLDTVSVECFPLTTESSSVFRKALQCISSTPSLHTICFQGTSSTRFPADTCFVDIFHPLLNNHFLKRVTLTFFYLSGAAFKFTDNDLTEMARAWPRLVDFEIFPGVTDVIPSISIASLYELAYHCPELERISILHPFTPITTETLMTVPTLTHQLRRLEIEDLWDGTLADRLRCAYFVDRIFPNLFELFSDTDWEGPKLSELILKFQSIRRAQMAVNP
ncbi:hypothetical protein BKA93DRAFT_388420 [Sparassis latifolia]